MKKEKTKKPVDAAEASLELVRDIVGKRISSASESEIEKHLLRDLVRKYAQAEQHLVELNEVKNRFLGIAAHDLRSPLSSIKGLAEFLMEGENNSDRRQYIDCIAQTAHDMLRLVNDLLDVAAIESGRLDLHLEERPLKVLIENHVRLADSIASRKRSQVKVDVEVDSMVHVDSARMGQVIDNLLSNAIKYSPPASVITIRVYRQGEEDAWFEVIDQGPGFKPEDFECLFGEFQKLSARPTAGEKSIGLGLAIVKRIIDGHGGRILVENHPQGGAVVKVGLPLRRKA